jgi:hypothetical protein
MTDQELENSLRRRLDMESMARKLLLVDPLRPKNRPIYDMGCYRIGSPVYFYEATGDTIKATSKHSRIVKVPMFEIKIKRDDSVDEEKAFQEIKAQEEARAFALLDSIPNEMTFIYKTLNLEKIADAFSEIEKHDLRVGRIFINPIDCTKMRKAFVNYIDDDDMLWGAQINSVEIIPAGHVFITAEPEYVGRLPVRRDATVRKRSISEKIGMAFFNPRAVVKIISTSAMYRKEAQKRELA